MFELLTTVMADGGNLEFATARRGGAETVAHLRRRIAG
jgi:hypothetical protein